MTKLYPCPSCDRKMYGKAGLCKVCCDSKKILHKFKIYTPLDIKLKNLTYEQRMLAFIYCATGSISDYFEDFAVKKYQVEEGEILNLEIPYQDSRANFSKYKTKK